MRGVEATLSNSDINRVIRYINTTPMNVSLDQWDSVAHDIERYCAFRQHELTESENMSDIRTRRLQNATDLRTKALEEIDKYVPRISKYSITRAITIVHLLTNKSWGDGSSVRFLSCRQSIPTRDRMLTTGDKSIFDEIQREISIARITMECQYSRHSHIIGILRSLIGSGILVESRVSSTGVVPCIELLPGFRRDRRGTIARLNTRAGQPNVEFGHLLSNCIENGFSLIVSSSIFSPCDMTHQTEPGNAQDMTTNYLVRRGQVCAVDFGVVEAFQASSIRESYDCLKLSRISVSRHMNDFSVVFSITGSELLEPVTVFIGVGPATQSSCPSLSQKLRKAFLNTNMDDVTSQNAHLIDVLVSTIKQNLNR